MSSHRQMVAGITEFIRYTRQWDVTLLTLWARDVRRLLHEADGLLLTGTILSPEELAEDFPCPAIFMGVGKQGHRLVESDEEAIGRLALEHLRGQGLHHFALCGFGGRPFFERRGRGFLAGLRGHESCAEYEGTVYSTMDQDPHESGPLHDWLRRLPTPIGIFTPCDSYAHEVLRQCRNSGLRVPEDAAVMGVDDDELYCHVTRPWLTSVAQNAEGIGRLAAELLEQVMAGQTLPPGPWRVAPRAVVARESTDLVRTDRAEIGEALRFIRAHAPDGISVNDVLAHVPLSRRALERGFQRNIGRTIKDEIQRNRIQHAKTLLQQTDLRLLDIAQRCGFSSASKFSAVFRRYTGTTPWRYRHRPIAAFDSQQPSDASGKASKRQAESGRSRPVASDK